MPPLRLSPPPVNRSAVLSLLATVVLAACASLPPGGSGEDAILSGTVTYLPRIALPPDAVVQVRLEDVSLADAPAVTLAEQTIPTGGRQVPLPFELRYDPARVEPRHRYSLRAEIRDGGGILLWTTDTSHPVLSPGMPSDGVEIRVVQVHGVGAGALIGPAWRLVRIEPASGGSLTPGADEPYSISFESDGRYDGRADCNRFGGEYEAKSGGGIELAPGPMTLAACAPPSSSDAFFGVLLEVDRYRITADSLRLDAGDAGALVLERGNRPDVGAMAPRRIGETFVWACAGPGGDGFRFTTRTGPGELAVWLPRRFGRPYLVLGQVRAASGAKYAGDGIVVWNKGVEALLEVDGETFTGCALDPAAAV